jgi:hypothetical protein
MARVASAALAALAAGCASGDRAGTVSFRDSAGVTIAENAPAAAQAAALWTIEEPALLTIGVLEGDSAYQFYHVGGAALLTDGRIAILDAGSRELRFFASDGRHEIGRIGEADHGMVGGRTFAPRTSTAVRGERFWIGTGAEGSVDVRDRAGTLRRIVRWDPGDRTVGPEDQARNLEERFGDAPPEVRRSFERVPALDRFPAYSELGTDAEGDLWVKAYRRPGDEGPDRWLVFDPDGVLIARLETPASMRILEAGSNRILCVVSDEFDVERIALFQLRKG